jgi:fructose-1-phosphate kinase PfkB-like protein
VKNVAELKKIIKTLQKNKIKFTVNTDGSEMYDTSVLKEQEFLIKNNLKILPLMSKQFPKINNS